MLGVIQESDISLAHFLFFCDKRKRDKEKHKERKVYFLACNTLVNIICYDGKTWQQDNEVVSHIGSEVMKQ